MKHLIDGIIIGVAASVPLGPIGVLCIQRTLNKGRLSGFVTGLGAAFSDTLYAVIAGYSLSFIIGFIEQRMLAIQIIGALILVALGAKIFLTNPAVQLRKMKKGNRRLVQDFLSTFFLTISNPLAIFLFLAFFAGLGIVDGKGGFYKQVMIILGVFAGASLWWFVLSSVINLFRSRINLRRLYWINKIAGALIVVLVIIAFAVFVITDYSV